MSNVDSPSGLKPVGHLLGSSYIPIPILVSIPGTYGANLFTGDPVLWQGTADADGYMEVNKATAGATNKITGVIVGFKVNPDNLSITYGKTSTTRYAYMIPAGTGIIFEIQACSGLAMAKTSIGLNAVLIYTHTGNTYYGQSEAELDSGTTTAPAADATYQLTIIDAVHDPKNDIDAINARWLVTINLPSIFPGIAGV